MTEVVLEVFQVGPDDWELWQDIRIRCLQESPDFFGTAWGRERDYVEADWRGWLSDEMAPCFLARVGDRVVAMSGVRCHAPGEGTVRAMWTDPAWRGRGLGGRMLDVAVAWARDRGLAVDLWVATENESAMRLYESRGFKETGETAPIRPGSAKTKVRMAL